MSNSNPECYKSNNNVEGKEISSSSSTASNLQNNYNTNNKKKSTNNINFDNNKFNNDININNTTIPDPIRKRSTNPNPEQLSNETSKDLTKPITRTLSAPPDDNGSFSLHHHHVFQPTKMNPTFVDGVSKSSTRDNTNEIHDTTSSRFVDSNSNNSASEAGNDNTDNSHRDSQISSNPVHEISTADRGSNSYNESRNNGKDHYNRADYQEGEASRQSQGYSRGFDNNKPGRGNRRDNRVNMNSGANRQRGYASQNWPPPQSSMQGQRNNGSNMVNNLSHYSGQQVMSGTQLYGVPVQQGNIGQFIPNQAQHFATGHNQSIYIQHQQQPMNLAGNQAGAQYMVPQANMIGATGNDPNFQVLFLAAQHLMAAGYPSPTPEMLHHYIAQYGPQLVMQQNQMQYQGYPYQSHMFGQLPYQQPQNNFSGKKMQQSSPTMQPVSASEYQPGSAYPLVNGEMPSLPDNASRNNLNQNNQPTNASKINSSDTSSRKEYKITSPNGTNYKTMDQWKKDNEKASVSSVEHDNQAAEKDVAVELDTTIPTVGEQLETLRVGPPGSSQKIDSDESNFVSPEKPAIIASDIPSLPVSISLSTPNDSNQHKKESSAVLPDANNSDTSVQNTDNTVCEGSNIESDLQSTNYTMGKESSSKAKKLRKEKLASADKISADGSDMLSAYTESTTCSTKDVKVANESTALPVKSTTEDSTIPVPPDNWEEVEQSLTPTIAAKEPIASSVGRNRSLRPGGGVPISSGTVHIQKYSKEEILKLRPTEKPSENPLPLYEKGRDKNMSGWSKQSMHRDGDRDGWKRDSYQDTRRINKQRNNNIPMPKKVISDPMEVLITEATAILNKITPQTFDKLSKDILDLKVLNLEMLDKLIYIIYEKAVQEKKFTSLYADLCSYLNQNALHWMFYIIVKETQNNHYFWIKDFKFDEQIASGPYYSKRECILAVNNEVPPVMRPIPTVSLKTSETLLVNGTVLLRIMENEKSKEYFVTYLPFSDVRKDKCSQHTFEKENDAKNDAKKQNFFRGRLVNSCQVEFNKTKDIMAKTLAENDNERQSLINNRNNISEEEYLTQESLLDEKHYKLKEKMLGTIRFIGELYKTGLISSPTMHSCIIDLLGYPDKKNNMNWKVNVDDKDIELVVHLLKNIGQKLENKATNDYKDSIAKYFNRLESLSKDKNSYNARIRFAMIEVIELRNNNWQDRRVTEGPLKISEIHEKAQYEYTQKQQQQYNSKQQYNNNNAHHKSILPRSNSVRQNDVRRSDNKKNYKSNEPIRKIYNSTTADTIQLDTPPNNNNNNEMITSESSNNDNNVELFEDKVLASKIRSAIDEYINNAVDITEIREILQEGPSVIYGYLILQIINRLLNKKNIKDKLITIINDEIIINNMINNKLIIIDALMSCEEFKTLSDYTMDCKDAPELFGDLISELIKLKVIDDNIIKQLINQAKEFHINELLLSEEDYEPIFDRFKNKIVFN